MSSHCCPYPRPPKLFLSAHYRIEEGNPSSKEVGTHPLEGNIRARPTVEEDTESKFREHIHVL